MSSRALLALAIAPFLWAQQPITPHVGYVYPAGGRMGTKFEITVGGQSLDGVNNVYVSGVGIQAVVVKHVKPLTPAQFNKLREELKGLMDKRSAGTALTAEDQELAAALRQKIAISVRRPATPAIAETVTLEVTLAPDAAPGERELRLATPNGLTNPLVFCVGQLPEFSKEPAKVVSELPTPKAAKKSEQPKTSAAPMSITLPAIVNGQIVPGGVDRYRFQAVKGQRLVVAASARQLIPYISDAVPGWFQATLALYDAQGKQVDYADHFLFHPDPVLYYEIPGDGEYVLEIRDSIYRGREDFVYRIAVGELPFITGIFPLGGKTGARANLEIKGWNLPVAKLTENNKHRAAGIYPVSVRKGEWTSNHVPFAVDTLPERIEKKSKSAQRVKLPLIVNGRIDRPGDWDIFRFDGRAGDEIVAEVFARRLDSPLDSVLKLTDATGRQLAFNDDFEDKGAGLITHQADSRILFKLPAKGTYYLHLGDTQQKGGPEYVYRLRISRPQPDFALRVVPSTINVRPGMTVPITVYALRQDGFAGEIALRLTDAPPGFVLSGGTVPPDQDKIRLTITAPPGRMDQPRSLHLEGSAMIQGREIRRPGVPAEDMMQAFAYRHLVPTKDWMVSVNGPGRAAAAWKLVGATPVKLPGRLFLPLGRFAGQIQLALNDPPEGITLEVSPLQNGVSLQLRADPHKAKPGLRGNLIVDAFLERTVTPPDGRPPVKRRQPLGALPAILFEIPATTPPRP
ncbi:MAG: hypothetical protein ABSE56_21430 [Bryobacteraceae bacterium]|jgi:hypothetical protein